MVTSEIPMVTVIYSNSRQRGVDTISGMSINLREALQQSTMNLFGPVDPIISTSSFVLCTIGLSKTLHEKWKPSVINHPLKKTTDRKKTDYHESHMELLNILYYAFQSLNKNMTSRKDLKKHETNTRRTIIRRKIHEHYKTTL